MNASNNVLKKQFQQQDVQRLRNLIQGKYGEKTTQSVGYIKPQKNRIEGEKWEEGGREWIIKNGLKQNITKLDKARKTHLTPLFCPKCSKVMKNRHDKDYYKIHKICFKCVILKEEQIKKEGKWDEYEANIKNNEIDNKIKDFKQFIQDKLSENNNNFISENGDVEKWVGKLNNEKVDEYSNLVIDYLNSLKIDKK